MSARRESDSDPTSPDPRTSGFARKGDRRDPLGPILALGRRQVRTGALLGVAGALIVHGAGAGQAANAMFDLAFFAGKVRTHLKERLRAEYDLEVPEPEPPPPPEPEPEPEAEPEVKPLAENLPPPEPGTPPPAPAEAANVLTAAPDPNEPLNLTDQGFLVGTGETYAGGITASSGTSKTAVRDLRAAPGGVGKAPVAAKVTPNPAPTVDKSQKPKVNLGQLSSQCSRLFPAEANAEGINLAYPVVSVVLGTDGRPKSVTVVTDPGTGFGNAARQCALRYLEAEPALGPDGKPVVTTVSLRIKFTR